MLFYSYGFTEFQILILDFRRTNASIPAEGQNNAKAFGGSTPSKAQMDNAFQSMENRCIARL